VRENCSGIEENICHFAGVLLNRHKKTSVKRRIFCSDASVSEHFLSFGRILKGKKTKGLWHIGNYLVHLAIS
jgi:hypothetical protein